MLATWHARGVTVEEDRASDRRIAVAFAAVLVVEVVLAGMADAGTYPLWVWLVLSVLAVLAAGLVFALHEGVQLAGDVGPGGLIGDLRDPAGLQRGDLVADLLGGAGDAEGGHQRREVMDGEPIAVVEGDEVAFMHAEMPRSLWERFDGGAPRRPAREPIDRLGSAPLVGAVQGDDEAGTARLDGTVAGRVLALVEDRPEQQQGVPGNVGLLGGPRREHPGAELLGQRQALRAAGADEPRHLDRPRRAESLEVQHAQCPALPLDILAPQQALHGAHVVTDVGPLHRPLAEHHSPGEARPDGDGDTAGRLGGQRGDGGGVDHRVAQARDEHRRPEPDHRGPVRGPRQRHPHVGVQAR